MGLSEYKKHWPLQVVLFSHLVLTIPLLDHPIVADEFGLYSGARQILSTGVPRTVHFPVYEYILAGPISLNDSIITLRLSSLIFSLLTITVLYLSIIRLVPLIDVVPDPWKTSPPYLAGVGALIYAVSPLATKLAILVDMEIVYLFLTSLFFYIFLYQYRPPFNDPPLLSIISLIGITTILTGIKIGILPALVISTVGYLLLFGQVRLSLIHASTMVGGFLIWLIIWITITSNTGAPFFGPLQSNARMASPGLSVDIIYFLIRSIFVSYKQASWIPIYTIGLTIIPLVGLYSTQSIRSYLEDWWFCVPIWLFAVLTFSQFVLVGKVPFGLPKYMGRLLPLLAFLAAIIVARVAPSPDNNRFWLSIYILTAFSAILFWIIPDLYLPFWWKVPSESQLISLLVINLAWILLPIFLGAILISLNRRSSIEIDRTGILTTILLIALIGSGIGIGITQANANYNVTYFYGDSGTDETVTYIEENCRSGSSIQAPEGFGYYLSGNFEYEQVPYQPPGNATTDVIVIRELFLDGEEKTRLSSQYDNRKRIQSFWLFSNQSVCKR